MALEKGSRVEAVAGGSLLVGGLGVVWDGVAHDPNGTWALIPAYLGVTIGLIALPWVMARRVGWMPAAITAVGTVLTLIFWYTYPSNATLSGFGGILIGIAVLWLAFPGRLASAIWVAAGVTGIPDVVRSGRRWGVLSAFVLSGLALVLTGAHVLGMSNRTAE